MMFCNGHTSMYDCMYDYRSRIPTKVLTPIKLSACMFCAPDSKRAECCTTSSSAHSPHIQYLNSARLYSAHTRKKDQLWNSGGYKVDP